MPHLSQTIPALPVRSIGDAVTVYETKFGFRATYATDAFAIVVRGDAEIHLWAASDDSWRDRDDFAVEPVDNGAESFIAGTASCRVVVDDVDGLYAELSAHGVLHSPSTVVEDTDYGTREFPALDADGNLLTFFRRVR